MDCAFQDDAFQLNAFQVCFTPETPDQRRWGPSKVIYREGEISYWWERRQRVEDEEIILL
jgi:hypothetical protein